MMAFRHIIKPALAVIGLTCIGQASAGTATTSQQYANYVILGQSPGGENLAIARTVIDPQLTCPTISEVSGATTINMITRDNPFHFPVMVCEALIEFDKSYQMNFADSSISLPMAKSDMANIQVFGDTGCKSSDCAEGTAAQPFKSLADSAVVDKPDVVLHMGDFNYRGTGGQVGFTIKDGSGNLTQQNEWTYDAGDDLTSADQCGQGKGGTFYSQNAQNANRPDSWQYWHDDLFMSSQKLMQAAPWIVARGNHELCSRAGPGYFYFLDPHSNLVKGQKQLSCPVPNPSKDALANSVQIPNYTVSFKTLDIAVIDSANACDGFDNSPFAKVYKKVFKDLNQSVKKSGNNTWMMTHRPIWGVQAFDGDKSTACTSANQYACINQMMQDAIAALPGKSLNKNISLVLSGHMHKFESVSFTEKGHPPGIIVGSSGVKLSGVAPNGAGTTKIKGLSVNVLTTNTQIQYNNRPYDAFGYLNIELTSDGSWQGQLVNPPKNLLIANCSSKENLAQGVCELAAGITVE